MVLLLLQYHCARRNITNISAGYWMINDGYRCEGRFIQTRPLFLPLISSDHFININPDVNMNRKNPWCFLLVRMNSVLTFHRISARNATWNYLGRKRFYKKFKNRGAWVAQFVERPTVTQVMISRFLSSGPRSHNRLCTHSTEPASDYLPLSVPLPYQYKHTHSLKNKYQNTFLKIKNKK